MPLPSSCHGASLSAFLFFLRAVGSRRPGARRSSPQRPRRLAAADLPGRHLGPHRLGCNLPPPWKPFPSARITGATPPPTAAPAPPSTPLPARSTSRSVLSFLRIVICTNNAAVPVVSAANPRADPRSRLRIPQRATRPFLFLSHADSPDPLVSDSRAGMRASATSQHFGPSSQRPGGSATWWKKTRRRLSFFF